MADRSLNKRRPGIALALTGLLAVLVTCSDDDDEQGPAPAESCQAGWCAERADGTRAGVNWPVLCSGSYCDDPKISCSRRHHVSAAAGAGGDGSRGSPYADLPRAASAAVNGDCVLVAPGSYTGAKFLGGVRILGAGAARAQVSPAKGAAQVLELTSGSGGVVRGLSLSGAAVGLRLGGAKSARITQLRIHATAGAGLHASGATGLQLDHVTVAGTAAGSVGKTTNVAMGVVLVEQTSATASALLLDQNAQLGLLAASAGVLLKASVVRNNGKGLSRTPGGMALQCSDKQVAACKTSLASRLQSVELTGNHGIALLLAAARVEADQLTVTGTGIKGGASRGISIHARGLASLSVTLTTSAITNGKGQGIVVDGASGTGENPDPIFLTFKDNQVASHLDRGIWLQNLDAGKGKVLLQGNKLSGNLLVGIGGVRLSGALVKAGIIATTKKAPIMVGGTSVDMGDGIQVADTSTVTVEGVTFTNNERIGLLFDKASGQANNNVFEVAAGAEQMVLQNGADKDVKQAGNKSKAGAPVKPTTPTTPYGISTAALSLPGLPVVPK